jgi:hypothetical protein
MSISAERILPAAIFGTACVYALRHHIRRFLEVSSSAETNEPSLQKTAVPRFNRLPSIDGHSRDNPAPQFDYADAAQLGTCGDKIVLIMVGLPGRGKTFISRKIMRYLRFFHNAQVKVFNNGEYRRKYYANKPGEEVQDADFFSTSNQEGKRMRERFAQEAMSDLKEWLKSGTDQGIVGIYDATNTTRERRKWTSEQLLNDCVESQSKIIFIESVVDDDTIVEGNMQAKIAKSDDYKGVAKEKARNDFAKRVLEYKQVYETLGEVKADQLLSYIKLVDAGRQVVVNRIHGYLPGRIVQFTMNLHTIPRTIYFSRHGQSEYNTVGKIGGDSCLSEGGEEYSRAFAKWVQKNIQNKNPHARLWTSSLRRTIETTKHITHTQDARCVPLGYRARALCAAWIYGTRTVCRLDIWHAHNTHTQVQVPRAHAVATIPEGGKTLHSARPTADCMRAYAPRTIPANVP